MQPTFKRLCTRAQGGGDEQLTQEQFYRFDAAVNAFDKDLSGAIDTGELIRMLTDPKTRNSLCSLN